MDDAPAAEGSDDADQGVQSDDDENRDDDLPRLTTEDDQSNSNSDSDSGGNDDGKDDCTPADVFGEDSVGNDVGTEEVTVSTPVVTARGRVIRKPNNCVPTMTGKSHGNSRDQGVNFPLVGKYRPDDDRDCIDSQYAGAGYMTKQGVVHFNIGDDAPPHSSP